MRYNPINPRDPEVKVLSFHGPSGEISVNVIAINAKPTAAGTFQSAFSAIHIAKGRHS